MNNLLIPAFLFLFVLFSCEPKLTGQKLIEKSIVYHDPNAEWDSMRKVLLFSDTRPGKSSRNYEVQLDIPNAYFKYINRGEELVYEVDGQNCLTADKESEACEKALMLRNYYTFLWGLPMKLMDKGTDIEKDFSREMLDGVNAYLVKVPFERDVWFFYLHPETFQMLAYKFLTDEDKGVGEIINLQNELIVDNMRIPAERSWFRTENGEFLGTDYLLRTEDLD
jgi:hypothetical protein